MTSRTLANAAATEKQMTNECAAADCEHDPAVVCHEQEPTRYQHTAPFVRSHCSYMMNIE